MNGFDAVSKFSSNPNRYSLIFMDIIMPEMDGVSATSSIRQRGAVIPIIAMTSNIRQEDITTYFEFGKFCNLQDLSEIRLCRLTMPIRYERCSGETIHQGGHGQDRQETLEPHAQVSGTFARRGLCFRWRDGRTGPKHGIFSAVHSGRPSNDDASVRANATANGDSSSTWHATTHGSPTAIPSSD